MPADPAIFGSIPPHTARFGNSVFGRIAVASGAAVIPIEALGYVVTPGPDVTLTLMLPRGPGVLSLVTLAGGTAVPQVTAAIPASRLRKVPTRANFKFTEGTSFRVGMNFVDLYRNPVNLTGAGLIVNVYQRSAPRHAAIPILVKTIGAGIQVLDTLNGKTMTSFLYTDTHNLPGIYDWEVQLSELNGDIYAPGMGVIIVLPARRTLQ